MVEAGKWLRDQRQADTLILGCAGMAHLRSKLEDELGVPVIEPAAAATSFAISAVLLQKCPA
jgi:Asp/Glu/hydantoin racemase